ncbi:hypothetical protein ACN082_09820 [Rothia sp. CCM 9417]|uniref:hypothetical protein n=1 Tax=Rothia sp. CCM 9417 TaxID=3402657 RepID=UPI003ADD1586
MATYLGAPGRDEYEPFVPTREQAEFCLEWYRLDPLTGRRAYRRGVLARPKGWGKSPFGGALCLAEGLADVVFDGWDSNGRPVGKPWSRVRSPQVFLLGVSEQQTENAWLPLLSMARSGSLVDDYVGFEPMETRVNLPSGFIAPRTASGNTREGEPTTFAILDQTESWVPSNGGVKLARVVRRNAGKVGGSTLEFPNSFTTGSGSVSEKSFDTWFKIKQGRTRDKDGLLVDSRDWGQVDLDDENSLMAGLARAYGDSALLPDGCVIHDPPCTAETFTQGWVDLYRLRQEIWDPDTTVADAYQYYGNVAHADANAFVEQHQWANCEDLEAPEVSEDEPVVLGFDGSRGRSKGVSDATALVAQRVSDGLSWVVGLWEQPDTAEGKDWDVPEYEVERTIQDFMDGHHVVGFYADPAMWHTNVAGWEAKYGSRLKVGLKRHPIAWKTSELRKTVEAVELLRLSIVQGEIRHRGDSRLTRHVLNARMRQTRSGKLMYKEFPDSAKKIDGAYALMLANAARLDALSVGDLNKPKKANRYAPRRVR